MKSQKSDKFVGKRSVGRRFPVFTGKAFSYHSQEVATNSSSDSEPSDAHGLILRCLQAHQEEQANYLAEGGGGVHIPPDGWDGGERRRYRWRNQHYATTDLPGRPRHGEHAKYATASV